MQTFSKVRITSSISNSLKICLGSTVIMMIGISFILLTLLKSPFNIIEGGIYSFLF